ncbi:hypothetical protein [Croceicoccus hydrothermalis]|uniref:hypothetical protein n=1 Tax=Croceicoccus hydrothermalis TaxID=2867964 RepID=UPI003B836218
MSVRSTILGVSSAALLATPAMAGEEPLGPVAIADGVTIDPILTALLRYEGVEQDNARNDADALTVRVRAGAQMTAGIVSALAEAEGTLAPIDRYNDTLPFNGIEPYPVVADPENFELNRLQLAVMREGTGAILGRQRIVLGDARFVGNVGWRQNEQTFDAVRGQVHVGPVALDAIYAISQRTIFGVDSPNAHFDGDFVFLNAGTNMAGVDVGGFSYLIDYDTRPAFSSQTYGLRIAGNIPLPGLGLSAEARFASQSDYGANSVAYTAEYYNLRLGAKIAGVGILAGYEQLGSDAGVAAFQTPMATLHAFQGWADIFLVTPANGIRDYHGTLSYDFGGSLPVPGLKAAITYHRFDSDFGAIDYGSEYDASLAVKLGAVALLAKYADYRADAFAVDTRKVWLQAEFSF